MSDWKIGHYAYGPQDGSSVWHVGAKTIRECKHPECVAIVKEWNKVEELQKLFDLRWKADMRAIKIWQDAHPGKELVWPDHADLVIWLLEQMDKR